MATSSGARAPCPWKTLGVPRTASRADIEGAYRRLALRYHPDVNAGCEEAVRKFQAAADAVRELRDCGYRADIGMRASAGTSWSSSRGPRPSGTGFQYGAQYAHGGAGRARRGATPIPRTVRTAAACAAVVVAAAAVKLAADGAQRARASAAWQAREDARRRDALARPAIGKGRRKAVAEETRTNSS